tara:strand:+ start:123 stop:377 length:255 start_codon:yes stop_codon:yes gene_type:complete
MSKNQLYWKANIALLFKCLIVWFIVSYGCGILLVDWLNNYQLFGSGYPLGFWFAQQGSIYAFVILIFYYVKKVNQLDKEFEVDE